MVPFKAHQGQFFYVQTRHGGHRRVCIFFAVPAVQGRELGLLQIVREKRHVQDSGIYMDIYIYTICLSVCLVVVGRDISRLWPTAVRFHDSLNYIFCIKNITLLLFFKKCFARRKTMLSRSRQEVFCWLRFLIWDVWVNPSKMDECPLKSNHVKKKLHFPTIKCPAIC